MTETLNTASDWHQLAIHKLADWTKLHVLILLFFSMVLYDRKKKFLHVTSQSSKTEWMWWENFIWLMS